LKRNFVAELAGEPLAAVGRIGVVGVLWNHRFDRSKFSVQRSSSILLAVAPSVNVGSPKPVDLPCRCCRRGRAGSGCRSAASHRRRGEVPVLQVVQALLLGYQAEAVVVREAEGRVHGGIGEAVGVEPVVLVDLVVVRRKA